MVDDDNQKGISVDGDDWGGFFLLGMGVWLLLLFLLLK